MDEGDEDEDDGPQAGDVDGNRIDFEPSRPAKSAGRKTSSRRPSSSSGRAAAGRAAKTPRAAAKAPRARKSGGRR